jgi:hypothetical protein
MTRAFKYILAVFSLLACLSGAAQEQKDSLKLARKNRKLAADSLTVKEYSDEYLDTVKLEKKFTLNNYSSIGVEYGVSINRMWFSPSMTQSSLVCPNTIGIFYTKYHNKLFGYMPYFGYKVGLRYTTEGYKFKEDKETGRTQTIQGATEVKMDFAEAIMMAEFHVDMMHFKLYADAGIYGGYRLNIDRTGANVPDSIKTSFLDTDRRFDYGFVGGVGFGIIFDPFEFRVGGEFRWGWGTLYDPDYYSEYYYRYAYPINIMINAGIYFHLTKRYGRSKAQLRREAREAVYNPTPPSVQ